MTISEFLSDKDRAAQYRKWIKSEIGIMVCSVLQEHFLRPILPGQIGQVLDDGSACFCLGENSGSWKLYDALRDLEQLKGETPEPADEVYSDSEQPEDSEVE